MRSPHFRGALTEGSSQLECPCRHGMNASLSPLSHPPSKISLRNRRWLMPIILWRMRTPPSSDAEGKASRSSESLHSGSPCLRVGARLTHDDFLPTSPETGRRTWFSLSMDQWGYEQSNGPEVWLLKYPAAKGRRQSPIDIVTSAAQSSSDLVQRPLTWSYDSQICKTIANTGCGWIVHVDGSNSVLSGGPLKHNYQLVQFHCHWGKTSQCGSEHTVDGKSYAAEIHFVHWNRDLFKTCSEALSSSKGLAVVAVLVEVSHECNPEIETLCQVLKSINYKDQRAELPADLDPTNMFPGDQSYWTYEGSLTTPPCYESVTWVVFKQPIKATEKQMKEFRNMCLFCEDDSCPTGEFEGKIIQNFRPPQPLFERCVLDCSYG